jgi:hypothetical protein
MVFKFLLHTFSILILTLSIITSSHASTVEWSGVALYGPFPSYSFTDTTLGTVTINYSNGASLHGIGTTFGNVDTLLLGTTDGESLTMSWTNNDVFSLEIPIWDIDGISTTAGESVTFVTSATVSPVSLHPTDVWDASTQTLSSDGTLNTNSDTDYTIMSYVNPAGFNSITFNWNIIGDTTGGMGIGDITITAVPVPAAIWLFGSGLIGLIGFTRRMKL